VSPQIGFSSKLYVDRFRLRVSQREALPDASDPTSCA
jgi:hypothetical protein